MLITLLHTTSGCRTPRPRKVPSARPVEGKGKGRGREFLPREVIEGFFFFSREQTARLGDVRNADPIAVLPLCFFFLSTSTIDRDFFLCQQVVGRSLGVSTSTTAAAAGVFFLCLRL